MLAKADFAGLQFLQQWEGHPLARLRWACIHLCTSLFSIYLYIITYYLSESYLRRHMRRCAQRQYSACSQKGRLDPSKLVLSDGMMG